MPDRPIRDPAAGELTAIYQDARSRLERLVRAALERGAAGTAEYRSRQLQAVLEVLAELRDQRATIAPGAVERSYTAGALVADEAAGSPNIRFSGIHRQAIDVLAANLNDSLEEAEFTVGRRTADAFRTAGLRETAAGIATGSARREVSAALERKLLEDRITDALTGFVDKSGRRWPLDTYAEMVARTTTREAVSLGTANRLREVKIDIVTISTHADSCTRCLDYQGKTYSLDGQTAGYEVLDQMPPFHPNCRHVLTPASHALDDFEREIEAELGR